MPNQSRSGITGNPWHHCARCGYAFRISELMWQEGKLLCAVKCWDSQTAAARDMQLARINQWIGQEPDAQVDPKLTEPGSGAPEED